MSGYDPYSEQPFSPDELGEIFGDASASEAEGFDEEAAAWELMAIQNDGDMEAFFGRLGSVFNKVKGPIGSALKSAGKQFLKKMVPVVAGAAGNVLPGAGPIVGALAGRAINHWIGNEAAGMSESETQLELARRCVRTLGEAARSVTAEPAAATNPRQAAVAALGKAARRHLPGLAAGRGPVPATGNASGTWVRYGNRIVIQGA